MIYDTFKDIIKHTSGLGLFDLVKVTGTEENITVESIVSTNDIVLKAELSTPIADLQGTVGLSRIPVLSGYLNFAQFSADNATIAITNEERNGKRLPTEISFTSPQGHEANYRFMMGDVADAQIQVPPFKGATWHVEFSPSKSAIRDLSTMNNILGSYESDFMVKMDGTTLNLLVGQGASDRTKIPFASGLTGTLKHGWCWPINNVLAILKLHDTSKSVVMSFSDQGILKIEVDSGMGIYQYYLPAKVR